MSNRKKKVPFPPWCTKKKDGIEKRFIRLGDTLLKDFKFMNLSSSAKVVYIYMLLESSGKQIFEFPCHKYIRLMAKPTFRKAREELISNGFIEIESDRRHMYKSTIYRFLCKWKE